ITERFRMVDGKATWTAGGKDGSETLTKPAFYVPTNSPTELLATLARALLKAPQHRLALLPSGEATLAEAGHLDVQTPEGKVKISQYRISGLGFTAQSVWLNADGKTVANASRWLTSIGATYRDALPKLMEAQEEADNAWSKEVAQRLAHTAKGDLLIRNVRLFDPRDLSVTPNSSVLVRGERVIRIGPDAGADAAADVEIVDGKGRFLMPGMWDNHQHFSGIDGLLDLANGVTSARDMANNASLPARVARFDAGTELGPRVLMSGIIDGPGKFAGPTPMLADTPAKAREFVDWYADHGYRQIKIYSSLPPELVPVITDRAHERGMRVSGHVPATMSARQFIEAGADEMQHINFVVLNFLADRVKETRNMNRFTEVAAHAREYPPERAEVRDFIALMKKHHTTIDPTVGIYGDMFSGNPDAIPAALVDVAPRFPPQVQRSLKSGAIVAPKGEEAAYREAIPALLALVKALHDAGVPILAGTDAMAGYSLHHELALYAKAGIPNAEVLRIATLTPAEVMGMTRDLGAIAPGRYADMVLIDGDPLKDIADTRRIDLVFKGGTRYVPSELEQAIGMTAPPDS
ncbi:MAG: amidohydrolase family protein, partial [Dokdonella sp.]